MLPLNSSINVRLKITEIHNLKSHIETQIVGTTFINWMKANQSFDFSFSPASSGTAINCTLVFL